MIRLVSVFIFGLLLTPSFGQQDTIPLLEDSVIISATRLAVRDLTLPQSSTYVNVTKQLPHVSHRHLGDLLYQVPGVFSQNGQNYAQDLRISLRGFGSRAAFGIRGIKLVVDGVPETTPDGQGQLDNIAIADISSIQVLQGSSGGRYGNAAGGVLFLSTDRSDIQPLSASVRYGSFGYQQYRLATDQKFENYLLSVSGTHARSDGFRAHSRYEQTNLQASLRKKTAKEELSWLISYTDSPIAQDPGGINLDQATEDPRSAREQNVTFDAGEAIDHWKTSLSYTRQLSGDYAIHTTGFLSGRNFLGRLPFENGGAIDLSRIYGGGTLELQKKQTTHNSVVTSALGVDLGFQSDDRIRFLNLEGTLGDITLDQIESFDSYSLYVLQQRNINSWTVDYSLRFDNNRLAIEDNFLLDDDASGSRTLRSVNWSLGISKQLGEKSSLYVQHSTSFETPTLSELSANPENTGGFNQNLDPSRAWTYEVGWKHNTGRRLKWTSSLFYIKTSQELIPFELDQFPGRTFFMNAAETDRLGVESTVQWSFADAFSLLGSYTYADYTFGEGTPGDEDLAGIRLPGIPSHLLDLGLTYHKSGLYSRVNFRFTDSISLINDATVEAPSFSYVELYLGYEIKRPFGSLKPFISVHNLLDTSYFDNLRINAFGSRFYEPAAGRNVQFGLTFAL